MHTTHSACHKIYATTEISESPRVSPEPKPESRLPQEVSATTTDSTARLLDLCTRRRLAWLDERRLWERVSFLVEDDVYFKPTTADVVADAAVEWQAAVAMVRGLDAAIALEVAARRMDREKPAEEDPRCPQCAEHPCTCPESCPECRRYYPCACRNYVDPYDYDYAEEPAE